MDILDFLRSDGSIVINKKLAHEIGLNETIIYSELVSLYKYWKQRDELTEEGWFFCTYENLFENTAIQGKTASRTTNRLVKLGLIKKKRMGLPAKTYYKITNGIYDLLSDIENKNGQNVRTDEIRVSDDKNFENHRHRQNGQNVQSTTDKLSNNDQPKSLSNNTEFNNTNLINEEEEEIKKARADNSAYEMLNYNLRTKGIDQQSINLIIKELMNRGIDVFLMENVEKQYTHMMDKLSFGEVDNHNGFAVYFANGLQMRTMQTKASRQYQKEKLKEYEISIQQNERRDTSLYYNWLEE